MVLSVDAKPGYRTGYAQEQREVQHEKNDATNLSCRGCRHALTLEAELQRSLHNTWWRGTDCLTEGRAANVAVDGTWATELRVIEDVECLYTKQ